MPWRPTPLVRRNAGIILVENVIALTKLRAAWHRVYKEGLRIWANNIPFLKLLGRHLGTYSRFKFEGHSYGAYRSTTSDPLPGIAGSKLIKGVQQKPVYRADYSLILKVVCINLIVILQVYVKDRFLRYGWNQDKLKFRGII